MSAENPLAAHKLVTDYLALVRAEWERDEDDPPTVDDDLVVSADLAITVNAGLLSFMASHVNMMIAAGVEFRPEDSIRYAFDVIWASFMGTGDLDPLAYSTASAAAAPRSRRLRRRKF